MRTSGRCGIPLALASRQAPGLQSSSIEPRQRRFGFYGTAILLRGLAVASSTGHVSSLTRKTSVADAPELCTRIAVTVRADTIPPLQPKKPSDPGRVGTRLATPRRRQDAQKKGLQIDFPRNQCRCQKGYPSTLLRSFTLKPVFVIHPNEVTRHRVNKN